VLTDRGAPVGRGGAGPLVPVGGTRVVVITLVTTGPETVVVVIPEAKTVDVVVKGAFFGSLAWLSLVSAPAKRPMKTAARRRVKRAKTRRILVRVVNGSLRMSVRRSPKDFRGASS
jgi:hypothetical protein